MITDQDVRSIALSLQFADLGAPTTALGSGVSHSHTGTRLKVEMT
jgi:hypothetical protein